MSTKIRESGFQAPVTHTNGLMNAWEVWDPVVQCSVQAGRVLKGCGLMQCGDMGRGVGECKEIRECGGPVPKIGGGGGGCSAEARN